MDAKRDEDFGTYLTGIIQTKEEQIRNKDLELMQAFVSFVVLSYVFCSNERPT